MTEQLTYPLNAAAACQVADSLTAAGNHLRHWEARLGRQSSSPTQPTPWTVVCYHESTTVTLSLTMSGQWEAECEVLLPPIYEMSRCRTVGSGATPAAALASAKAKLTNLAKLISNHLYAVTNVHGGAVDAEDMKAVPIPAAEGEQA